MEAIYDMQLAMTLIEEKGSQQIPSEEYNKVLEIRQTAHGKRGEAWFLYILASINRRHMHTPQSSGKFLLIVCRRCEYVCAFAHINTPRYTYTCARTQAHTFSHAHAYAQGQIVP